MPANAPSSAEPPRPLRIALVAGEASGDQLGAPLIDALRARWPDAEFAGIGGPLMREAGLDAWHDCSELAVMGLAEVLRHLPRLLRLRLALTRRLLQWQPDLFVGIDAPDFNLGLERRLKAGGIRTAHYVSPSVWAWRQGRAARIGRSADQVLCLFPMEPAIYARHGVDARFVGHPLAARFPMRPDRAAARQALGLADAAPVLGVLPGSRLGEIERLGADFIEAARRVRERVPGLQVVAPMANAACDAAFARLDPDGVVQRVPGQSHAVMFAADVLLLASGTAALEGMLAKRPMVVAYRIAPLTHWLVRTLGLLKVRHVSLPNVLAGRELVPELLQDDCRPGAIADALCAWFVQPDAVDALLPVFDALHAELDAGGADAAASALDTLLAR